MLPYCCHVDRGRLALLTKHYASCWNGPPQCAGWWQFGTDQHSPIKEPAEKKLRTSRAHDKCYARSAHTIRWETAQRLSRFHLHLHTIPPGSRDKISGHSDVVLGKFDANYGNGDDSIMLSIEPLYWKVAPVITSTSVDAFSHDELILLIYDKMFPF